MTRAGHIFALVTAVLAAAAPIAARPLRAGELSPAPAVRASRMPAHGTASDSFASSWTGAFVTGDGRLGAMVMGSGATPPSPAEDTIFLSQSGQYVPMGNQPEVPDLASRLADLRQTVRTRGYIPAMTAAFTAAQQQDFPGMTFPDPFLPALEMRLRMPLAGTPRDYLRTENFQTGEVSVYWSDDRGRYVRRVFVSRADHVMAMWIGPADLAAADRPAISCSVFVPPIPSVPVRTYLLNNSAAAPADAAANSLVQGTSDVEPGGIALHAVYREGPRGPGYDAAVRVIPDGGTAEVSGGAVEVRQARGILVLARVEPSVTPTSMGDHALLAQLDELPQRYDLLLERHVKLHGALFDRVTIDLGGGADRAQTTDVLLARANVLGELSPALLERLYEGSRYQLLCASDPAVGTGPNLQGIWTGTWSPAPTLAGDHSFDAPFQLAVSSALSCRTPELLQGVFRLVDQSLPDWRENARRLYGARGILVPMHQSSNGKNLLWSDRMPGALCWTPGAGLLAHWYYEYYLYTGDREFLAKRAVPFMAEAAAFYEDFLIPDASGRFRFSPSYSAENTTGDNSTQDIMVARELLTNLIAACKTLRVHEQEIPRWQKMLAQMPPYLVAPDGQLQEWALPGVSNRSGQRHIPHLYAIYQGHEFDPETTPKFWNASRAAFEARLNQWFKPPTRPGDTNPQPIQDRLVMGLCAARFGQAATVTEILTRLGSRNVHPSMMSQRYEDGRTLVADGAAIAEIVNSSLVFSEPGRLTLLPALPEGLAQGEVCGLAARSLSGPITLDRLAWTPQTVELELSSPVAQSLVVRLARGASHAVSLKPGMVEKLSMPR